MSKRHFIPRVMEKAAAGKPQTKQRAEWARTLALLQEDWDDWPSGMAKGIAVGGT